jgi:uncharacterized protein YoxC
MKKLIEFVKGLNRVEWLIIAACVLIVVMVAVFTVGRLGSMANESRIGALESEKQQALKERDEARARDLILQGQIQAKDEVIQTLTSQIAESNERVVNAHNETQTAKQSVQKVRSDPPKFNSADDAGRTLELGSELRGLYPDTP